MSPMACLVCDHKSRRDIDRALVSGRSKAGIGREYEISEASLSSHLQNHLSRQMAKSGELMEKINASTLLQEVDNCKRKAYDILTKAEADGKPSLQLAALREIRQTAELLCRLLVSVAEFQQRQELAEMANGQGGRTVIVLPRKIDPNMDATVAGKVYSDFLKTIKDNPDADFQDAEVLPGQEPEQDDNRTMVRRRTSSATRIKASASTGDPDQGDQEVAPDQTPALDQEEDLDTDMVGPSILDWVPNIPKKRSTWG